MELDLITFLIVCPLVFLGGLVDAVAGGGGLIALPAYLIAGVPAHLALGTNKLSSAINSYRARTGDKSAFSIRVIEGGVDGLEAVGVWKEDKEFTPRPKKAVAEVAAEVTEA